ncbi:MAG TPA: acyl-CoA dehydrogenase family protein, partial [Actinomycetota bacterium]|nr:acyl-CoA dehydrogenase family protein [Actinomycetota bacterium]
MDLDLTEEQVAFRDAVRAFAADVVAPAAAEFDRTETFPVEIVRRLGELGVFGLPFPEEVGGLGSDLSTLCLCLEELGRADSSVAITVEAAVGLGANPIYKFGTAEQQREWLGPMCRGEILGAFGLTEAGGGSDAHAIRTRARLEDGEWRIDGSKAFITNSGTELSKVCTVAARDEEAGDLTMILVPLDAPGVTVGPPYRKMGWHASDTHELSFDGVRVPEANLLGTRGRGYPQFLEILDDGRVAIAALSTGLARGCLEESVRYATEREAFGRQIGAFEGLQFKIADMKVKVENARSAYLRAGWLRDNGRPFKTEAAIAKLYASEIAVDCA